MGSEAGIGDLNLTVHVAVGKNVKEGKSLLTWAVENFPGANICLVHVHPLSNSISSSGRNLSGSKLKNQAVRVWQEFERLKMQKLMNQYFSFLSQMGIQAGKVLIEMKNIDEGILQLIIQHNIRRLVMGSGAHSFNTKKLLETNTTKATVVCQQAPQSCRIWFVSKGHLVYERPLGAGSYLITNVEPPSNSGGTTLSCDSKENMEANANKVQFFELPSGLTEEVESTISTGDSTVAQINGGGSPSSANFKAAELICSSSNTSPGSEFQEKNADDVCNKLEHVVIVAKNFNPEEPLKRLTAEEDASEAMHKGSEFQEKDDGDVCNKLEHAVVVSKNSTSRTTEESLKIPTDEEDVVEAMHKVEAADILYKEELNRRREVEELIHRQQQDIEMMKNQHDQILKDLQLIKKQKPELERQLKDSYCSEKELEDRIIQAVNLLITFKGTRDQLQLQCDSVIGEVNKYRALETVDLLGIPCANFFETPFSEIIEATQNFNPSQKIGEGRYGSVFRGMLFNLKVAIKMLPSSSSLTDWEFKNEIEVLCRVRHPNLVTLIGSCPESRSLIYEYIENGSLEDYLSTSSKTCSLSWQNRIRIAIDICSALLFLHSSCSVHGNIKPSNILLDSNYIARISDFGICNLVPQINNAFGLHKFSSQDDAEGLAYFNPESVDSGEITTESDIYSFGVVLLRLLTARPAAGVVRDVQCALESGNLGTLLDMSAGDWPLEQVIQLATLALRCSQKDCLSRPDLALDVWPVLEPMREACDSSLLASTSPSTDSGSRQKVPSYFVCPIYQEVMKDPHIAADGFTYEADAIKGWFDSGHMTSPMTNLKLGNTDLLPNYALYNAIQEWRQMHQLL